MIIYVDGGVKNTNMYIGILSLSKSCPIKFSKKLGNGSTHTAEEQALLHCIQILSSLNINEEITIYCDQNSIVNILTVTGITSKALKTFPNIQKIKDFIVFHNIKIKWIKGKENIAHTLITEAYTGIFYNEVFNPYNETSTKIIPNKDPYNISYIEILQKELLKKDIVISDLMNIITKSTSSIKTT